MAPPAAAACPNHPAREAIGVCVKCRTRVCDECSTKINGINHCVRCLAALAGRARAPADVSARAPGAIGLLGAVALVSAASLLTWALLEIALPR